MVVGETHRMRIFVGFGWTGVQTESGQVLASATSLTVCLKCVLALGCHWRASSLAAAPPLPPFSILPGDSVSIHFSTAAPLYVCQIITILKKNIKLLTSHCLFWFLITFPSLWPTFCLIFCCYCICAVSGFLILWYGCRDQSVMLPVSESECARLFSGCCLFVAKMHAHTVARLPFSFFASAHAHRLFPFFPIYLFVGTS